MLLVQCYEEAANKDAHEYTVDSCLLLYLQYKQSTSPHLIPGPCYHRVDRFAVIKRQRVDNKCDILQGGFGFGAPECVEMSYSTEPFVVYSVLFCCVQMGKKSEEFYKQQPTAVFKSGLERFPAILAAKVSKIRWNV